MIKSTNYLELYSTTPIKSKNKVQCLSHKVSCEKTSSVIHWQTSFNFIQMCLNTFRGHCTQIKVKAAQSSCRHTSTHFSRVFIQTLAVVTLAVASADQSLPVGIIAHAAAAVTGACQRDASMSESRDWCCQPPPQHHTHTFTSTPEPTLYTENLARAHTLTHTLLYHLQGDSP